MWKRIFFFLFTLFCLELGLFLMALPWTDIWDRNVLLQYFPALRPVMLSNYFRGALSGLGLLNIWVGLSDIWHFREHLARLDAADRQDASSVVPPATVPPSLPRAR